MVVVHHQDKEVVEHLQELELIAWNKVSDNRTHTLDGQDQIEMLHFWVYYPFLVIHKLTLVLVEQSAQ